MQFFSNPFVFEKITNKRLFCLNQTQAGGGCLTTGGWRESVRTEWRGRAMPGEFFSVLSLEKILTIFFCLITIQGGEGQRTAATGGGG